MQSPAAQTDALVAGLLTQLPEELTPNKAQTVRAVARLMAPLMQQPLQQLSQQVASLQRATFTVQNSQLQLCGALSAMEATTANTAALARAALEQERPQAAAEGAARDESAEGFFGQRKPAAVRSEVRRELIAKVKAEAVAAGPSVAAAASAAAAAPVLTEGASSHTGGSGSLEDCGAGTPLLLPWPADLRPLSCAEGTLVASGEGLGAPSPGEVRSIEFYAVHGSCATVKVVELPCSISALWVIPNTRAFAGYDQWHKWLGLYETPAGVLGSWGRKAQGSSLTH